MQIKFGVDSSIMYFFQRTPKFYCFENFFPNQFNDLEKSFNLDLTVNQSKLCVRFSSSLLFYFHRKKSKIVNPSSAQTKTVYSSPLRRFKTFFSE